MRTLMIQAAMASRLMARGSSSRASLISTTSPLTGAMRSEAALTLSMAPKSSPASISSPTSGMST